MNSKGTPAYFLQQCICRRQADTLIIICRPPGNLELKAVPRPSMQDRHSASLNGLRQSKAVSDAVPGFVSATPKESIKWKQDNSMCVAK